MSKIKGFIFDMDGVITDTSEYHYTAWKLLASKLDIYIDREVNEKLKGVSRMASLDIILEHGGKLEAYTEAEKLAMATQKNKHYVDMISRFTPENLLPGVGELFDELKVLGIKIGIASASKSASHLVDLLGIREQVDFIADPAGILGKPAPDIFLSAAKGLGLDPLACIGVEDAIAGITAIKAAGMYAVGIGEKSVLTQADIVFKEPKDIDLSLLVY